MYVLQTTFSHLGLVVPDHLLQSHANRPARLPTERFLRSRGVRAAFLRIVSGYGLVHDVDALLALDIVLVLHLFDDITDKFSELPNRELVPVANIDGPGFIRVHEKNQAIDEVVDILEGSGLLAVSIDRHIFAFEGLDNKVGDNTAIIWVHCIHINTGYRTSEDGRLTARAISVEYTGDTDINAILTLETIGQGLSNALSFVVASAGPNWVNVSPAMGQILSDTPDGRKKYRENSLIFVLGMNFRITINLCEGD